MVKQRVPDLRWKVEGNAQIPVPPTEHPRLYLRKDEIQQLRYRTMSPELCSVYEEIGCLAGFDERFSIEWKSLQYLLNDDELAGRSAILDSKKLLQSFFLTDLGDICFNSRQRGRALVSAAVAYDWCYSLLEESDKKELIASMKRLAASFECGFPLIEQRYFTSHASEACVVRDMLSAGIAVYDEDSELYDRAAEFFFSEMLPARNWAYKGHFHYAGNDYGPYRFQWELYALWIFEKMGAGQVFDESMRQVPYFWIYSRRPDGQLMRAGDCFKEGYNPRGHIWSLREMALLHASYFEDGYVQAEYLRQPSHSYGGYEYMSQPEVPYILKEDLLFELLWRETGVVPKPVSLLPLTREFSSPCGIMIARTGWHGESVIAEMRMKEFHFSSHDHLDAGTFQIYYKGPLAISSGNYIGNSGGYGSAHCQAYYWRSISKNSLSIFDPDEVFSGYPFGESTEPNVWPNDGGQRLPNERLEPGTLSELLDSEKGYRVGEVLRSGCGADPDSPDYSFMQGDISAAYSDKVEQVKRSFVFINRKSEGVPAVFITFDRVISSSASFKKKWLLHCMEKPELDDEHYSIKATRPGETGELILTTLLPEKESRDVELVGGVGQEFVVDGDNFENNLIPEEQNGCHESCRWRMEVGCTSDEKESVFLNVMQVKDQAYTHTLPVKSIFGSNYTGAHIGDWVVLFDKRSEASKESLEFEVEEQMLHILILDRAPGTWLLTGETGEALSTHAILYGKGACQLDLPVGNYQFCRQSN